MLFLLAAAGPGAGRAAEPYQATSRELTTLAAEAAKARRLPLATVVEKPQASPSGDPHDYVSFARYYWPDPTKPDGLPYINHDGRHNHEQVARGDHERLWKFAETVEILAAGWEVQHDPADAARAVEWLRAWFVTPATRMNPNLDYAQVRLGRDHNHGSNSGVLDARCLSRVIDALRLLDAAPALTKADQETIQAWFRQYLGWLQTAKTAQGEYHAKNNHGSWFLAQIVPIARYCGRDDLARQLCEEDKARIASQILPDGSQPEEIRRVDGLGYSAFNLEAQFQVARLAAGLGIDLWHYTAPNGASLRKGLQFLEPYNQHPEKWPTSQKAKLAPGFLDELRQGARFN